MKATYWLGALVLAAASTHAVAAGRLADLQVHDRVDGRRLPVYWHEGRAYVVGKPGFEYRVSVRNRAGEDLLAVVSVDGVNVITGESADPRQSGYVIGARRALDIQGWRKNMAETAAFYFTSLPDSYAARTWRPEDVGVIGVALFKRKVQQPPAQAPAPISGLRSDAARESSRDERLGTGHGRRETSHATHVDFERASSAPAEFVTLYYDSHRNLVARGVIRESVPVAPLPRPFPGFVPDPQG